MAFPASPVDAQTTTDKNGIIWVYDAATNKWNPQSPSVNAVRVTENYVFGDLFTLVGSNFSTASTTPVATGLKVVLATRDKNNSIELRFSGQVHQSTTNYVFLAIYRDGAIVTGADRVVNFTAASQEKDVTINWVDLPGDTVAHTYEIYMWNAGGTGTLIATGGGHSTLTVKELNVTVAPAILGTEVPDNFAFNDLASVTTSTDFTTSSPTAVPTGLATTLAATHASNQVHIEAALEVNHNTVNVKTELILYVDGVAVASSEKVYYASAATYPQNVMIVWDYSPGDTATHTYAVYMKTASGIATLGGNPAGTNGNSTIHVRELKAVVAPTVLGSAPINLGTAGADVSLAVGQVGYVDFSGVTSTPLNVAASDGQKYELILDGFASVAGSSILLQFNNTTYASGISRQRILATGGTLSSDYVATSSMFLTIADPANPGECEYKISVNSSRRNPYSGTWLGFSSGNIYSGIHSGAFVAATALTSLGTIAVSSGTITGRVTVRRII